MIILATCLTFAISIFLLLENNIVRRVLGLVLLGSCINLVLLICGRTQQHLPVFIGLKKTLVANPLPQALILTAIVIGFALFAFLCALIKTLLAPRDPHE